MSVILCLTLLCDRGGMCGAETRSGLPFVELSAFRRRRFHHFLSELQLHYPVSIPNRKAGALVIIPQLFRPIRSTASVQDRCI
jgi:hypothetical protein